MIWTKCQNMLRWSGQNANQKVGTDKMPTTEKSPDKMPTFGWHYVRLAFCPVGILSYHHAGSKSYKTNLEVTRQNILFVYQGRFSEMSNLTVKSNKLKVLVVVKLNYKTN